MGTKRLFIAVDLDRFTREVVARISAALATKAHGLGKLTWVKDDRLHLTLHFFGEADEALEQRILDSLSEPLHVPPFALAFRDLGFFPARGSPRVLWLGISEGLDQLRRLHLEIERRLGDRQGARETFNPHLTLARVRSRVSRAEIAEIAGFPAAAGPAPIDRVTLYESRLSPKGPAYVALAEARLKEQT